MPVIRYVKGKDGRPITGLSQNKSDGRYYATHSKPRKWFGKDYDRAVMLFRTWEGSQGRAASAFQWTSTTRLDAGSLVVGDIAWPDQYGRLVEVGSAEYWATVAEAIKEDAYLAAQMTGLPLHRLTDLDEPEESLKLTDIVKAYVNKKPTLNSQYRREVASYWKEFVTKTGKQRVRELKAQDFQKYRDAIYSGGTGKSPRWVNNRFTAIVTVFSYALKEGKDVTNLRKALDLCKMMRRLGKEPNKPTPISRSEFEALLKGCDAIHKQGKSQLAKIKGNSTRAQADKARAQDKIGDGLKWRAILLTALNMAAYPVDICQLKLSDIDLQKRTLCNIRTKTGTPRVAVLWKRTVDAITAYRATVSGNCQYVFVSRTGDGHAAKGLIKGFDRVRKAAKCQATFASIRDGSQTAAIQGGANPIHTDILLGHRSGIKDAYLLRNPEMVRDACEAIEKHYFG